VGAIQDVETISVTTHPGLPGSLVVGKAVACYLGSTIQKTIDRSKSYSWTYFLVIFGKKYWWFQFPMVVLTASGWHNDIYLVNKDDKTFSIDHLGKTLDDAAGECFDKVSRMLGDPILDEYG
jgi:N6-L-threonylcarbamoyladenine synthase